MEDTIVERPELFRTTDDGARQTAASLMDMARFAALAFVDPASQAPSISRIGLARAPDGTLVSLMSELAGHKLALRRDARAALLIGQPGPKGDPLNSARLSLHVSAASVSKSSDDHMALRQSWLESHPKAGLYIDFADFGFVRFQIIGGLLNGGFARAYRLTPDDLA